MGGENLQSINTKGIGTEIVIPEQEDQEVLKWCWQCRRWLTRDSFHVDSGSTDGLQRSCKLCQVARIRLARRRK